MIGGEVPFYAKIMADSGPPPLQKPILNLHYFRW